MQKQLELFQLVDRIIQKRTDLFTIIAKLESLKETHDPDAILKVLQERIKCL